MLCQDGNEKCDTSHYHPRNLRKSKAPYQKSVCIQSINLSDADILYNSVMQAMKNPDCEIVSIDWLLASIKAGKPLDAAKYLIVGRTKRSTSATSDSNAQSGGKRKATSDSVDSGNESNSTDKAKENMLINFSKLSAMVDKASHNQKDSKCDGPS